MRNNIDVSQLEHLRDEIYRAFEGEIYGYPVCILATKSLPEFDMGDYYCGYVGGPSSHPLGYMDNIMAQVDVNVNGGFTYSRMADSWRTTKDEFKDYWFFGFDCAHYWNEEHPCSFEDVKADCECLALALKNYKKANKERINNGRNRRK